MTETNDMKTLETIRNFLLNEFLPDEDPADLTDSTELVTSGVLDSIALLTLIGFLEEEFGVEVDAHEADVDNFNTLSDITRLVESKRSG